MRPTRSTRPAHATVEPTNQPNASTTSTTDNNRQYNSHNTSCAPLVANNVHTSIPHLQNRVKYMHQSFFCPLVMQTLINAANLGFLDNIPFLMPKLILKHLEKTPATAKGRMKLRSMGLRNTRRDNNAKPTANHLFCFAALTMPQYPHPRARGQQH